VAACVIAACVIAASPFTSHAQDMPALTPSGPVALVGTAAEQEALASLDAGKFIRAREQAQTILDGGESMIATFVLASVYYEEEANHPRALFLLREAKGMLAEGFGARPTDPDAQRWHKRMLRQEIYILGEMDRREEELAFLESYDSLYTPPLEEDRIWALVKLGRYSEAEAIGKKLITSDDFGIRRQAYNGLIAMANEQRDRKGALRWGVEGMDKTQDRSCVIASNTALAAIQNMQFSEVEPLIKKAKQAEYQDCSGSPYAQLVSLYLVMGEFQKTISSLDQLHKEPMSVRMRSQFEMYNRSLMVNLFYALGQLKQAEERMAVIINAPDRVGMTSASLENVHLGYALLYWSILQARQQQLAERLAALPTWSWDRYALYKEREEMSLAQWERRRAAISFASQQDLIVTLVRPYFTEVSPWQAGALTELFGAGVVREAVAEARAAEAKMGFDNPAIEGYFDALLAEAAWRDDDPDLALTLIASATQSLPSEERLLRWRLLAIRAHILWPSDPDTARELFHEVLQQYPTTLRQLALPLPVEISHSGDGDAPLIADLLAQSPRFVIDPNGFIVQVSASAEGVNLCISNRSGQQYTCLPSWEKRDDGDSPPEQEDLRIAWIIEHFLDRAFSPRVELTQSDINTLDGRTGRINADAALQKMLGSP
jgi:hypothetical protein